MLYTGFCISVKLLPLVKVGYLAIAVNGVQSVVNPLDAGA